MYSEVMPAKPSKDFITHSLTRLLKHLHGFIP